MREIDQFKVKVTDRGLLLFSDGDYSIQIISYGEDKTLTKYRLKKSGNIPVIKHSGIIKLGKIDGDNTVIIYKSAFYRKYLNNELPPEENDEASIHAISDTFKIRFGKVKEGLED